MPSGSASPVASLMASFGSLHEQGAEIFILVRLGKNLSRYFRWSLHVGTPPLRKTIISQTFLKYDHRFQQRGP